MKCILNLVDPSFDPGLAEKYSLSIQLRPDGFSFCIFQRDTDRCVALADYRLLFRQQPGIPRWEKLCDKFNQTFRSLELIQLPFGKTRVAFSAPKLTLVPAELLRNEAAEKYFRFNHTLEPVEQVVVQTLDNGKINAVYALPFSVGRLQEVWFTGSTSGSSSAALIQGLLSLNRSGQVRQVYLNSWGNYFDLVILQGAKLLYFNTFRQQAAEDLVYYVIFVLEQMGLVPGEEKITLLGDISIGSEAVNLLAQYIDSLEFAVPDDNARFSPALADAPYSKYFTLFNLPFCE